MILVGMKRGLDIVKDQQLAPELYDTNYIMSTTLSITNDKLMDNIISELNKFKSIPYVNIEYGKYSEGLKVVFKGKWRYKIYNHNVRNLIIDFLRYVYEVRFVNEK